MARRRSHGRVYKIEDLGNGWKWRRSYDADTYLLGGCIWGVLGLIAVWFLKLCYYTIVVPAKKIWQFFKWTFRITNKAESKLLRVVLKIVVAILWIALISWLCYLGSNEVIVQH